MRRDRTAHPIWGILRADGRYNLVWLAARTGYSHSHVKAVAAGIQRPGPRFRAACAALLGLDEADLFHADSSSAGAPGDAGGSDAIRAGVAVALERSPSNGRCE